MNRVAAQNARDRRKNYVEDLEKRVALLEQQVLWCAHSRFICLTRNYQFVLMYLEQTAAAGEPITEGALRHVSCWKAAVGAEAHLTGSGWLPLHLGQGEPHGVPWVCSTRCFSAAEATDSDGSLHPSMDDDQVGRRPTSTRPFPCKGLLGQCTFK